MIDFEDKVVVITGAAQGIGRALAFEMIPENAILALSDTRAEKLEDTGRALKRAGAREVHCYPCDISDEDSCNHFAARVAMDIGPVSLLCAHAGIGVPGGIMRIRKNNRAWALAVNVGGMLNTLTAFLPGMQVESEGERHIMMTGSMVSFLRPRQGMSFYAMTKYAVLGMAEALRADLSGTGITASVLCPGLVNTRIWASAEARQEKFGGPREVDENVGKAWEAGLSSDRVAKIAMAGLRAGDFYIFVPCLDRGDEDSFIARLEELRQAFEVSMGRYHRQIDAEEKSAQENESETPKSSVQAARSAP